MLTKENIADWFRSLQVNICQSLERADSGGKFKEDMWQRPGGGGGRSRILTKGKVIEKGGVNFSAVEGQAPKKILEALGLPEANFFATGVSIVLHPYNPFMPIIHMNVRYFEMTNGTWWFGGGIDLTPHYVEEKEAAYFHDQLKKACDQFDSGYYRRFKQWADDYFYIQHRKETRGVGGIFFDRLDGSDGKSKQNIFEFVQTVGNQFAPIYTHLMSQNSHQPFNEENKTWQKLRRGRYVEFNLILDKGTRFGLETDGRTESILMSLPPEANWIYDYHPEANSAEEHTQQCLQKGVDWVALKNSNTF